jgi:hypothetical protein
VEGRGRNPPNWNRAATKSSLKGAPELPLLWFIQESSAGSRKAVFEEVQVTFLRAMQTFIGRVDPESAAPSHEPSLTDCQQRLGTSSSRVAKPVLSSFRAHVRPTEQNRPHTYKSVWIGFHSISIETGNGVVAVPNHTAPKVCSMLRI